MYSALAMMADSITACANWFVQILGAVTGFNIWISAVFVWLSYKFLFAPLFGVAKSDLAKHSYNAFKRRKEE